MNSVSPFDLPDDADALELRTRLTALLRVLDGAPVPIAVAHDAACRLVTANGALARLLGIAPDANISMTPPPGDQPPYRIERNGQPIPTDELPMQYAIAHRTHVRNDIEIVRADGSVVYVQNDVEPLYDVSGDVYGCVSVCVDLTARRQAEGALREADRRKDEFLATLAHELRNPLAPIRNALELLRQRGDERSVKERALAIMGRQLQQLVRLTDDLLDVSRITNDRLELRRTPIDLRTPLLRAVETAQPVADAAGHTLAVALPSEPIWVNGDIARITQAVTNLLNNAIRYTDHGGRVALSATVDDDGAVVRVADTGIGIATDAMPRIFDMYLQLERSSARAQTGLGIGLTLTKRLVELHGGHIEAHSDGPGTGTTFTIRLPISAVAGTPPEPLDVSPVPPIPGRVLVAEDVPDAAEMLRLTIEAMGHDVRVASDGLRAVAEAAAFAPHIALLDISMPRMDGYEAARRIRAALGDTVVLVALTGWGQEEDQQRAREAGFDHHLTKPADPAVVERLIALATARRSARAL